MPTFSVYRVLGMERDRILCWEKFLLEVRAPYKNLAEGQGLPELVTVFKKGVADYAVVEAGQLGAYLTQQITELCIDHYLASTPTIAERAAKCGCPSEAENYSLHCPVHGLEVLV